ncbi:hypothetical protein, partial [Paraburkholderia aspalathi]|uniref:hypothetical protein n=1 Tax=Paraburkholderia aspalathi TaxID=1324617 RepID=UPI001BA777DC
ARHPITVIHIAILSSLKMLHAPRFNASRKGRACWIAYSSTAHFIGRQLIKVALPVRPHILKFVYSSHLAVFINFS